jgi:hypothetical protein
MSVIKPRTRGKRPVRHRTRLDQETNETLYAYAQFLAARGHYALTHQPVREPQPLRNVRPQPAIPSITERNYTLSFGRDQDYECSWLLSFPAALGPRYPIRGYPAMTEFRAMLEDVSDQSWNGRYFSTVVAKVQRSTTRTLWLTQRTLRVELSEAQWHALGDLFRRLRELQQEYGEQG